MNHKGFTLVEILIVVAIIGIVASIATVNFNRARAGARDVRRVVDIRNIATALYSYLNTEDGIPCRNWEQSDEPTFMNFLVPKYLPATPKDPLNVLGPAPTWYLYGFITLASGGANNAPRQAALLEVTFEKKVNCNSILQIGDGMPGEQTTTHCHFFIPDAQCSLDANNNCSDNGETPITCSN